MPRQTTPFWKRRPRALSAVAALGVLLFALWGIGGPLAGSATLTPTNEMVGQGPWSSNGYAGTSATNTFLDDTYTSELPSELLFKQQLGHGKVEQWNPYNAGGTAFGSIPDYAFFSPLTVPFYVLPGWLAPAYERLLEIVVAAGGTFLFLRRVSLSRPAALLGGIAFAGSGFMVAWLGFPQTRVGAFIPVLFWTIERFIQQRRARDAALVALPVAALLLGGFPSVTGYTLLTAGSYVLVRLLSEHRADLRRRADLKRLVRPVLYLGGALAAGIGLALFQLMPFLTFYKSWMIEGRDQVSSDRLPFSTLWTMISPFSFGTVNPNDPVQFVLSRNMVEDVSYIGAAAAVLMMVTFAMPRRSRAMLPIGGWVFFVAGTAVWAELIYVGGFPLGAAQKLPILRALFESNYIGRARSILGFLLAVLVAVGFELLLRARTQEQTSSWRLPWTRRQLWGAAVVAGGTAFAVFMAFHARTTMRVEAKATGQDVGEALKQYRSQTLYAAVLIALAIVCVVVILAAARPRFADSKNTRYARFGAATVLILLAVVQGAQFMRGYYPHSDKADFYPVTDTHTFLADNLGHERYASTENAIVFGTNTSYDLRALNGHTFLNASFATMLGGVPGVAVPYTTYVDFWYNEVDQATSPVLDRLGIKYWVAPPAAVVFGTNNPAPRKGTTQLIPGKPVTVPVTGPLRAVGFTPEGRIPSDIAGWSNTTTIDVVIRDGSGKQIAEASRLTGMLSAQQFQIAVAADDVPAGTPLTATLTLHARAPLTVDADNGLPAVDTIGDANDGLRVVYAGSTVVYQRTKALPRIRWASQSTVVPSESQRVSMLASGSLPDDTVVLSDPGPAAAGQPATVQVSNDGTDSISTRVDAQGAGYLVVADADQVGWQATVDGHKTGLVKADEGLVAVPVPAGTHTVALSYHLARQTAATYASAAVGLGLLSIPAGAWWRERRRRQPDDPAAVGAWSED